jgi:hypothetical protein
MTKSYKFKAQFTKSNVGAAPSSAPTIKIVDSSNNILVAALTATTALSNMPGVYTYSYTGASGLYLIGRFTTTDATMDKTEIDDFVGWLAAPVDVVTSIAVSESDAEAVSSGALAISTAYTLQQTVSSTTTSDLSAATKLWLAVKKNKSDADTDALLFVEKTAGLTRVDGTAYTTTTDGTLTVTGSSADWDIAIYIDEAATALLDANSNCVAAVKALVAGNTVDVWSGTCVISWGTVEAVI